MAKEAPRVPGFGALIRSLRGERSLESLANQMRAVGVERVNSALFHYEAGRLPPVDVLRGFSFALRVPFEELVNRIFTELEIAHVSWGQQRDNETEGPRAEVVGDERRTKDDGARSTAADRLLRTGAAGSPNDAEALAATRASLERIMADLAALAEQLPRRQASMARLVPSGVSPRPGGNRKQLHRSKTKKQAPKR
jgi:hypothetical protein